MAEDTNTGQSFGAKDFSSVDDIISIIDNQKDDSSGKSDSTNQIDMEDNGIEYGVGRQENKFSSNADDQSSKSEQTASDQDEGTQVEQSASSDDTEVDKPDAEDTQEAQESQSEDQNEGKETTDTNESDSGIELKEDEELIIEMDDGSEVPIDQIVDDWQNNQNWQKANTEKAQQLADEKRQFDESIKGFKSDEVGEALKNDELMEALDDWFEGGENNPFRTVVDGLENVDKQESTDQNVDSIDADRMALNIDKEIFELQKVDEGLKDDQKLNDLVGYAMQHDLKLTTAHKLLQFENLNDEVGNLKAELKDRNKELSESKKQAQKSVPQELPVGKGASKEDFSGTAGTWRNAEDRVLKKLGLN